MTSPTGWIVTKVDKFTNTLDPINLKVGYGNFVLDLIDPNGVQHKISALGLASGFTTKKAGATKANGFGMGGGRIDLKELPSSAIESFIKDYLKYINYFKESTKNMEIIHSDYFRPEDPRLGSVPSTKSFLACSLNLFSLKLKGSFIGSIEGSLDFYTFIAGHHFTPLLTAYYFVSKSIEAPLWDFGKGLWKAMAYDKEPGIEISLVQYYCPFIGMDSSGKIDSGIAYAKELYDANEKLKKKAGHWLRNDDFKREPMISPDN